MFGGKGINLGFWIFVLANPGMGNDGRIEICRIAGLNDVELDLRVLFHQVFEAVDNVETDRLMAKIDFLL